MKKMFILGIFVLIICTNVLNAETKQSHWLTVSPGLHLGGSTLIRFAGEVRYEYMLNPFFSVGTYAFYELSFGVGVSGRYYPFSKTFFLELGLGYNKLYGDSIYLDHNTDQWIDYIYNYNGIEIIPGLGWRMDVGKPGGLFISPSVKYPLIYRWYKTPPFADKPNKLDPRLTGALIIYIGLGYAF